MTGVYLDEQDFPFTLKNLRILAWPVQAVSIPANLYVSATLVVKADFGELGYVGNEWQSVYADIPVDEIVEPADAIVAVCAGFLLGGISRQETSLLHSDNWGVAIDQIDKWTQLKEERKLVLHYQVKNLGQCQVPDVCLSVDLLVFRPRLRNITQGDPFSALFTSSAHLETGAAARHVRLANTGDG